MKKVKWKCANNDGCLSECEFETTNIGKPDFCPMDSRYAKWEAIAEEHQKQDETVTDCNQLPDWCKVGEWVYVPEIKEYFKITDIQGENLIDEHGDHLPYKDCVQARLRPYNAEEMKALVGKVIEWDDCLELVTKYNKEDVEVFVDGLWANAEFLMNNGIPLTVCLVVHYSTSKTEYGHDEDTVL